MEVPDFLNEISGLIPGFFCTVTGYRPNDFVINRLAKLEGLFFGFHRYTPSDFTASANSE